MKDGGIARVVHFSPGRVRLRVEKVHRTGDAMAQIEGFIGAIDGVSSIETRVDTGSVLINYDPGRLSPGDLLKSGEALGLVQPVSESTAPQTFLDALRSQVEAGKVARSIAFLVAAALGGMAGPGLGLSSRVGSFAAVAAMLAFNRIVRPTHSEEQEEQTLQA